MKHCLAAILVSVVFACAPASSEDPAPGETDTRNAGESASGATGAGVDSQATYSYEGCESKDYGCENSLTLACAVRAIASANAECRIDSDCAFAEVVPKCSGMGQCPPLSVAVTVKGKAETAIQAEVDRYCATATCGMSSSCGAESFTARCVDGTCRTVVQL